MKTFKFHQFVFLEIGPVNTCIVDLLKGNLYQVKNDIIEDFLEGSFDRISEFIQSAEAEELIIETGIDNWIPRLDISEIWDADEVAIRLELEEGVDLELIKDKFRDLDIPQIVYFGEAAPDRILPYSKILKREKNIDKCIALTVKNRRFGKIPRDFFVFNHFFNSCWGKKIAVTKDGKVRPCIHSDKVIAELDRENVQKILEMAEVYWRITKDRVKRCRDCELRYTCFDCRVIPERDGGDLYDTNPNCKYDPFSGEWRGI